jgi:hypothetical protein
MKVKDLIAALQEHPPDFSVELGKVLAIKEQEAFEVVLDSPIIGLAVNEGEKDLRLVVQADAHVAALGKVTKFS